MSQELPTILDIRRLIDRQRSVSGVVSVARLSRIKLPYKALEDVVIEARLSNDDPTRPRLTGRLKTNVAATCQRCLEDMIFDVEKHFDLVLQEAVDQEDARSEDAADIFELRDDKMDIEQFVGDEVMLACPMIPLHDDEHCHAKENESVLKSDETTQPFVGLAELLATSGKKSGA
jgi:uncharacterized protein